MTTRFNRLSLPIYYVLSKVTATALYAAHVLYVIILIYSNLPDCVVLD